jgi:hypothetical protein
VTVEARLAFLLFFFLVWFSAGTLAWAIAAVWVRGQNALLAFPLALAGAGAFGIMVPLLGLNDALGFILSIPAAFIGGALGASGGIALSRRIDASRAAAGTPVPAAASAPEPASDTLDT